MTKAEDKKVLAALRDVAGTKFQESDIKFEGTELVLPARWTTQRAIDTIQEYQMAQEEVTSFNRQYMYRPFDGAAATERAIRALTGMSGIAVGEQSFFGKTPPQRVTIDIGLNDKIDVPWGTVRVPLFDGTISIGGYRHNEYGQLFTLRADAPKRFKAEVNGFFDLVQQELELRSIYKGQAFTGGEEPEYIDLSTVDPDDVIYSDMVMEQLNAHLWGMLDFSNEMRENGVSLKRSVLLHGPYGTGKTLGGILTGQKAVANDFTFIMCRPGKDNPFDVLQTAQLYAPAVVFIEDIDTYSRSIGMGHDTMSELLDKFDGVGAKGREVIVCMTTNHEEQITKGMLRPGRLDALIHIEALDRGGVERMVLSLIDESKLDNVDYDIVFDANQGYLPAFVAEAVTRAKNASIVRGGGKLLPINTADLVNGAMSLRAQFDLMERADEVTTPPTLDTVFSEIVAQAANNGIAGMGLYSTDEDYTTHEIQK